MNRLNLDFSLQTSVERTEFLKQYLKRQEFINNPMTQEEIEMCSNYVLWGREEDGKNLVQKKEIQIQTKNSTWNKKEEESLDALLETPTFNENLIVKPNEARPKVVKENFSRKEALAKAPPYIIPLFQTLFNEIDELDLLLNYYDLQHGKRIKEPREELLQKFSIDKQESLKEKATHLNQYKYLKLRHQLVDLRRQQFSLKDMYSSTIQIDTAAKVPAVENFAAFDADIKVYPLGLKNGNTLNSKVFNNYDRLNSSNFSDDELDKIIKGYWKNQKEKNNDKVYFDFEDLEHIYNLLLLLSDLEIDCIEEKVESTLGMLLDTLKYYISITTFTPAQEEILNLKIKHIKNQDIAKYINEKYNKSYTANYISTIFRQKIIKKIVDTVTYHKDIVLNLPYEENFKHCSTCGRILLRDSRNFVKKSRSKDGFTSRCKDCDKIIRDQKKEAKNE